LVLWDYNDKVVGVFFVRFRAPLLVQFDAVRWPPRALSTGVMDVF
jgi:hypothetical protein